jgi:N-acetyl-alpha-D-muramate 1-phosphate uridylyltransferase
VARLQAVILAGGLGTRLKPLTETVPKAMAPVRGRPFIDYQVELLRSNGITELVLCVGYLGELIEQHLGDGRSLGVRVVYSHDGPSLLGPAGALRAAEKLVGESFFVTYGDAYLRAPYRAMMDSLVRSDMLGVMAVFKNENRLGRSDVSIDGNMVGRYDKNRRVSGMDWINYGVTALRKSALYLIPPGRPCGEEEFYGYLIERRKLGAYQVTDRFYEIGTTASLEEFEHFISS